MDAYLGEIRMFAGSYPPKDWFFCHGDILSIAEYTDLFSVLGTIYGGNGRNTFALPDLRGRAPISAGRATTISQTYYPQGSWGGLDYKKLTFGSLPVHKHSIGDGSGSGNLKVTVGGGDTNNPEDAKSIASTAGLSNLLSTDDSTDVIENCVTSAVHSVTGVTGNGQYILNMQPYLPIQYIICYNGIYPPRN